LVFIDLKLFHINADTKIKLRGERSLQDKITIAYIGTYTSTGSKGIVICKYDVAHGILKQIDEYEIENPSFVIVSHDKRFAYAVIENDSFQGKPGGGVAAFRIDQRSGALTLINTCPTFGKAPCHLCVDKSNTRLAVANYNEGTISCFALSEDGGIIAPATIIKHRGNGPNNDRHIHFVGFTQQEELFYAVDLGTDTVNFYRPALQGRKFRLLCDSTVLAFTPGSGPRHLTYGTDNIVYAVTELTSQIEVFRLRRGCVSEPLQSLSLLPADFYGENWASAIKQSIDGKFLYAGNRGHDSIAVLKIKDDGMLQTVGWFATGGIYPRDIALSPDGSYLFAANQNSNSVTAFAVNRQTGALESVDNRLILPSPVCICFVTLG
jgi:3-carboxymuconate cyclase